MQRLTSLHGAFSFGTSSKERHDTLVPFQTPFSSLSRSGCLGLVKSFLRMRRRDHHRVVAIAMIEGTSDTIVLFDLTASTLIATQRSQDVAADIPVLVVRRRPLQCLDFTERRKSIGPEIRFRERMEPHDTSVRRNTKTVGKEILCQGRHALVLCWGNLIAQRIDRQQVGWLTRTTE